MCLATLSAYDLDQTHPDTNWVWQAAALLLLLEAGCYEAKLHNIFLPSIFLKKIEAAHPRRSK